MRGAGRSEAAFLHAPIAVVLVDPDGTITAANRRARSILGPIEGRGVDDLIAPGVRQRLAEQADAILRCSVRGTAGPLTLEVSGAWVAEPGASELSLMLRELSESEGHDDRFRSLLEAAPDAMVIVDEAARIVIVNRQVQHVFGYRPDELVGQSIEMLVPARYRDGHGPLRDHFLAHPTVRPMGEGQRLFAVRKDGSEFPVEISLSPLVTDDGVLVSAAVRDVTERLRTQAEADRVRDELIATVSHELRTPLTSIIGYVELLREEADSTLPESASRMLAIIERNANRELRLVNDLLDLAFLDHAVADLPDAAVDVGSVVRSAAEGVRVQADSRQVELIVDVIGRPTVRGDAQRLGQVLDNLMGNAIKFTPSGGEVRVTAAVSTSHVIADDVPTVVIGVSDNGPGIAADELPQIFERLYRASAAVRDQVPGAGLGLSIARTIVDAHRGRIEAESEVGVGTTMRVLLPADHA